MTAPRRMTRSLPRAALFGRAGGRWPTGAGDNDYRFGDAYDWQNGAPVVNRGGRLLYGGGGMRFGGAEHAD